MRKIKLLHIFKTRGNKCTIILLLIPINCEPDRNKQPPSTAMTMVIYKVELHEQTFSEASRNRLILSVRTISRKPRFPSPLQSENDINILWIIEPAKYQCPWKK